MTTKSLQNIFKSKQFSLPYIETEDTKSFLHHFNAKMKKYKTEIESLHQDEFDGYNKVLFLKRLEYIISNIEKVMDLYLNGFPASAYLIFSELIKEAELDSELLNYRSFSLDSGYNLYRTKKEYDPKNLKYKGKYNGFKSLVDKYELFHAPFQHRKSVPTNRFSIPGFPCLYVSDSLYTSWSEAISENDSFHAICFSNHRPLYLADLSPINYVFSKKPNSTKNLYNEKFKNSLVDYAILYPLILACHSKIKYIPAYKDEVVKFKSEYIIPQLLMQWYRENKVMVDGIRYLSCTAVDRFPKKTFNKFNYVIPVVECKEVGYCSNLLVNFSSTQVYSYIKVNKKINNDELIKLIEDSLIKSPHNPLC